MSDKHLPVQDPIPIPLTSFIGRDEEVAALAALLQRSDIRLVTLTGPGGIGKTRLALQAMETVRSNADEAAAWVSLAPVRDPYLVLQTMAQALNLPETADIPIIEQVTTFVARQPMLLVLDNLEHVIDAVAPVIADMLRSCPGLTVLATSRTRLGISGEQVLPVAPLDVETARKLFCDRAGSGDPTFVKTADTESVIDTICDRLDRVPLAIELAAARVNVLPLPALLERLDRRLDLLVGGPRDAPDRQRTMRDTIAWSHDLLGGAERVLFRRLGVFVGGFTLEAAEAVGGEGTDGLGGVSALVAASLVNPMPGFKDEPRFTMLETIREYALKQLAASGEEAAVRNPHAAWCLALAEHATTFLHTPDALAWATRLETEHANLRAALTWLSESPDVDARLRLITSLVWFWFYADHWSEGWPWLERAVAWSAGERSILRVRVLTGVAYLPLGMVPRQFNWPQLEAWQEEALAIAREIGDIEGEVEALGGLSEMERWRTYENAAANPTKSAHGIWDEALHRDEATLALLHDHAETIPHAAFRISILRLGLAAKSLAQGNYARATHEAEDALAYLREVESTYKVAESLFTLGVIAYEQGDLVRAVPFLQEALDIASTLTEVWLVTVLLDRLAIIAGETAQAEAAAMLGGIAERRNEQMATLPNALEQPDRDRARDAARAHLGEAAFDAAWAKGRALTVEQALAVAQTVNVPPGTVGIPHPHRTAAIAATSWHGLSPREVEVLKLVAAGHSNSEIAATLFISIPTVKRHVTTILGKLGLPSRSAATAYAHTHALL